MYARELALRPTVWVVDDSPLDAQRAEKALADACSVRVFSDGSSALERVATHRAPDVLVLDWVMPGISGIEVLQFLRSEQESMPQVPVLLLTARNRPEQIVEGLSAGANDYLAKPYAPEELRARVEALLRSARLLARAVAAEKAIRDLLSSSPDALLAVDAEECISFANAEAGRLFGCPTAALVGRHLDQVLPDLPLQNALNNSDAPPPLADLKVGDRIFSPSVRVLRIDAEIRTTIALRDVTARRAEEERRLDFYSIIAHDLRSPLSAMTLRTDLLLQGNRGALSPAVMNELRKFDSSIRSMTGLINDFLDLARLEGSERKIDPVELELGSVISTTVDELRPLADAGGMCLEWSPPRNAACVLGDRSRLAQVLSNLIGNAIKFTPSDGKVAVQTSDLGHVIETRVSDTGPGVPPDAVPTLFNRFTRVRDTSQSTTGTGLGLMIVREIVEAHGGKVGVTTEVGKGSTFWFRLPKFRHDSLARTKLY
jgi:signal transduction histidine kinase